MRKKSLRLVQISDLHFFSNPKNALLGVKTRESFRAVFDLLLTDPVKPDAIILSGDLSQDETVDSYLAIAEIVNELPVPAYWIPGNHDDIDAMIQAFPKHTISNDKHLMFSDWDIILLNSKKPLAVEGFLDNSQLQFMENALAKNPNHHAIVMFHHHPIPVGCAWLDRLALTNADAMWKIIRKHPRAQHILFGHVHQVHEGERFGIKYFSAPSTCFQFKRKSDQFGIEKLNPGYRWVDLYSDGTIETGVNRVAEYIGFFDEKATGY